MRKLHRVLVDVLAGTGVVVAFMLVPLAVVSGCGGGDSQDVQDTTTTAPVNDASQPAIDGRFAVGPDGRELMMSCFGEGSPTIILVSGDGDAISQFGALLDPLATRTRTCA